MKTLVLALIALLSLSSFANELAQQRTDELPTYENLIRFDQPSDIKQLAEPRRSTIELASSCCKICRKGKACGDSCIKRSYICHKGKGCACDG